MVNINIINVSKDYCDVVIYLNRFLPDYEFSKEIMPFFKGEKKIRAVKIVICASLAVTIPFFQVKPSNERYSMSYVYFGSQKNQLEYVSVAKNSLSVISPSYFDIENNSLKVNSISKSFVNTIHSMGIKIVPFLSNHWNQEQGVWALQNATEVTDKIAEIVAEYNLDGINVDIENLTHTHRNAYTEFVKLLREKIPQHKEVSVAVAANPNGWQTGWQASYDYKALSEYADHLFIMAYDEHYQNGEPGPVASIQFVENSIKYALSQVSGSKLVLGVPFFGRIWSYTNDSVKGMGVFNNKAESLIEKYNGTTKYNNSYESAYTTFTIPEGSFEEINGTVLNAGEYEIWFETSDSLKQKLSLVDKYNLKGAGSWSLGQETADVWDYYNLWLNGKYFEDISSYFAKDDIISVAKNKYMVGTTATSFEPHKPLTRAQAAVIACRVLSLTQENNGFTDTNNHWAESEIRRAAKAGIIKGYPDSTFRPEQNITREEAAAIICRIIEVDTKSKTQNFFSDINESRWSYNEIKALFNNGIIQGYSDGTFRPEHILTRGEMAALINRIDD